MYSTVMNKTGRKTNYLVLTVVAIFLSLAFTSCEEDDGGGSGSSSSSDKITGTWKIYYSGWAKRNGTIYETLQDELEGTITFTSDGKYTGKGTDGNHSGTYTLKGNTLTIDGAPQTIEKFTSNEIVFEGVTETESYGGNTYQYYLQMTFRK